MRKYCDFTKDKKIYYNCHLSRSRIEELAFELLYSLQNLSIILCKYCFVIVLG